MGRVTHDIRIQYEGRPVIFRIRALVQDGPFEVPIKMTNREFWLALEQAKIQAEKNAQIQK